MAAIIMAHPGPQADNLGWPSLVARRWPGEKETGVTVGVRVLSVQEQGQRLTYIGERTLSGPSIATVIALDPGAGPT
jgi:hypothetical protein